MYVKLTDCHTGQYPCITAVRRSSQWSGTANGWSWCTVGTSRWTVGYLQTTNEGIIGYETETKYYYGSSDGVI